MIANYEEFRQIIIKTNGDFAHLMGPANVSVRVALLQFITGRKYSKAKAGINELKKELRLYTQAPTNECEAVIDAYVYEQILNHNARQLNIGKPKIKLNKHQEEIIEHILGKTEASTQTISIPTRASEIGQTPEYKKNRADFLKYIGFHQPASPFETLKVSEDFLIEKQFTAKDLLDEAKKDEIVIDDWFSKNLKKFDDMKLMTEENKDKFSRQPYERSRLSFEELISKFTNGREKYETDAFFNHCIRIMASGLSYVEMIEILFQHIDRQDEQINNLIKHSQIPVKLNQN